MAYVPHDYTPADAFAQLAVALINKNYRDKALEAAYNERDNLRNIESNLRQEQANRVSQERDKNFDSVLSDLRSYGVDTDNIHRNQAIPDSFSVPVPGSLPTSGGAPSPEPSLIDQANDYINMNNQVETALQELTPDVPVANLRSATAPSQAQANNNLGSILQSTRDYVLRNDPNSTQEDYYTVLRDRLKGGEEAWNQARTKDEEFSRLQQEHPEWFIGNYYTGDNPDMATQEAANRYNQSLAQQKLDRQAYRQEEDPNNPAFAPSYESIQTAIDDNRSRFLKDAVRKYGAENAQLALQEYDKAASQYLQNSRNQKERELESQLDNFMANAPDVTSTPEDAAALEIILRGVNQERARMGLNPVDSTALNNYIQSRTQKAGVMDTGGRILPYSVNRSGEFTYNQPVNKTLSPQNILQAQQAEAQRAATLRGQDLNYYANMARLEQQARENQLNRDNQLTIAQLRGSGKTETQERKDYVEGTALQQEVSNLLNDMKTWGDKDFSDNSGDPNNQHKVRDLKQKLEQGVAKGIIPEEDAETLANLLDYVHAYRRGDDAAANEILSWYSPEEREQFKQLAGLQ